MASEKSKITFVMDAEPHAHLEEFVAYRKSQKIKAGMNAKFSMPASFGGVMQEAVEMFLAVQRKKGWKPMS